MTDKESADEVRRKLLGIVVCCRCKKDRPRANIYAGICNNCWGVISVDELKKWEGELE